MLPSWWELPTHKETIIRSFLQQIPPHAGNTWIVLREDPRLERAALGRILEEYLRRHSVRVWADVIQTADGQIEVLKFHKLGRTKRAKIRVQSNGILPIVDGIYLTFLCGWLLQWGALKLNGRVTPISWR